MVAYSRAATHTMRYGRGREASLRDRREGRDTQKRAQSRAATLRFVGCSCRAACLCYSKAGRNALYSKDVRRASPDRVLHTSGLLTLNRRPVRARGVRRM